MIGQLELTTQPGVSSIKRRAADGSRSIFGADSHRHGWRAHMGGATAGVYGYLWHYAKLDHESFAFPGVGTLMKRGVPFEPRGGTRQEYSRRPVFYALRVLENNFAIIRTRKLRNGAWRLGWIVFPHELWSLSVPGLYCHTLLGARSYYQHLLRPSRFPCSAKTNREESARLLERLKEVEAARSEFIARADSTIETL